MDQNIINVSMDQEQKIKLAYRVTLISGIFCGVVALLLLLNFWHMKQHEPLESKAIEALVERLRAEPNNEELKEEIRSFDLLALLNAVNRIVASQSRGECEPVE